VTVRWYLEFREGARLVCICILLDTTTWLVMERDSVWRRSDGLVFNFHEKRHPLGGPTRHSYSLARKYECHIKVNDQTIAPYYPYRSVRITTGSHKWASYKYDHRVVLIFHWLFQLDRFRLQRVSQIRGPARGRIDARAASQ